MDNWIQHFSHHHRLTLSLDADEAYCDMCRSICKGLTYTCKGCSFQIHKTCAELPQEINHPFHPQHPLTLLVRPFNSWEQSQCHACGKKKKRSSEFVCNACGEYNDGLTFHCSDCEFDLDINCAFLMPVSTTDHHHHPKEEHQIDHHPHPLILCKSTISKTKNNKILFVCKVCRLPFDDDGSSMYCCLDCSNLLHKSCAELPDEIHHSFHPDHPLKFRKYSKFTDCMACLRENKGFAYKCLDCDFYIDIPCAMSTPLLVNSQIHKHQLAFFSIVAKDLQCNICHHIRKKSTYFRCVACNFNVHIYCVPKLPPTASDGNHRHPLTLTKSPVKDYEDEGEDAEFYCDRCENERSLRDPTYYCAKCHYVAHVHCVIQEVVRFMEKEWSLAQKLGDKKLATSIDSCQENSKELVSRVLIEEEEEATRPLLTNFNLHEHPLTFFRLVVDDLSCIVCNLYSRSNFFRCVPCNFNLHLLCIFKLPPTIFHVDHLHTLTLSYTSSVEEENWSYFEKIALRHCHVCGKERQLYEPMYYSIGCPFGVHIRCFISELAMDEEVSLAHKLGDTNLASSSTSIEENTTKEVLAMDEEGSLAHKLGDTKLASSTTSFELNTNQMVREVLINFSDFSVRHDDREEAIAAIHVKIKKEQEKLQALRKKYVLEQEFKVDALWKRVEALEKHDA